MSERMPPTSWGPWVLWRESLELVHEGEDYAVDLEWCRTSAEVLDWIAQIDGKAWGTPEVVGHLAAALCALLSPQATLCSSGEASEIPPANLRPLVLKNERFTLRGRDVDRWRRGQPPPDSPAAALAASRVDLLHIIDDDKEDT